MGKDSIPKEHGADPAGTIVKVFVEPVQVDGSYYAEVRRLINRRAPDGTLLPRTPGPQGLRRASCHLRGLVRNLDEAAALTAAFGMWLVTPADQVFLHMPTENSLKILHDQNHPWATSSARAEGILTVGRANATRQNVSTVLCPETNRTRAAMRKHLRSKVESGRSPQHLLTMHRALERVQTLQRTACTCGKAKFTKETAELALLGFTGRKGKKPVRAYPCPHTPWYHLTSQLRARPPHPPRCP